jgi:dihydrofolate synthase / folylpolyglutamate synthase
MTYEEALALIHDRLRFGSKLTLTRIRELLGVLGDPHKELRIIHVAGTNGKGSVSKYIYHALREHGYNVGLYTSPYLLDFRERIEADGSWIGKDELAEYTLRVLAAADWMQSNGSDAPTEFEIVMAMAFLYFKEKQCDYVVLEVGLGGKGDATNIIESPLASVITSISFDHMEYLGNTLTAIAGEKAGIIKPGCPVIYNVKDAGAREVIRERARELGCRHYAVADVAAKAEIKGLTLSGGIFSADILGHRYENVFTPLAGVHQVDNAITALFTLEVLIRDGRIPLDREKILSGLAKTTHIGRLEKLSEHPLVIIDGAHNAEGMDALCRSIAPLITGKKTLFVLGILKDKEFRKMLESALSLGVDMALSEPDNPRKASAEELAEVVASLGGNAVVLGDAQKAIKYAKEKRSEYDCFLFAGSLYFISTIRQSFILGEENK